LFRKRLTLDPSTDDFYRDAGVRLSPTNARIARTKTGATTMAGSRIPSIQNTKSSPDKSDGLAYSRLKQASNTLLRNQPTLPHFGIARGVQQVLPKPSIATGITTPLRTQRRSGSQLNAAKSRSQENLTVPQRPRAARPISTCLTTDFSASTSTKSPFQRSRLRASIGALSTGKSSGLNPPIATLPPKSCHTEAKTNESSKLIVPQRKLEPPHSVKLSDMKNALPLTSTSPFNRKPTGLGHSKLPDKDKDSTVVEVLESLHLSKPGASVSRLRKPGIFKPVVAGEKANSDSVAVSSCSPRGAEKVVPKRNPQWRRSMNFGSACAPSTPPLPPPPPPPRKNFATLPHVKNHNNNNVASSNSKLPVPALKRNSYLGPNV